MQYLYIIDAHCLLHRYFHAPCANLTAPTGEPTKATYMFTKYLTELVYTRRPKYLAVCFDSFRETLWRTKLYPEYKANRGQGRNLDLSTQINRTKQIVELLGYRTIRVKGQESDDLIASLVSKFVVSDDFHAKIVTADKDLCSLIDGRTRILTPTGEEWRVSTPTIKWGVGPHQITDYLTLVGDSSDNVHGLKGAGPKTAAKWLAQYKTLDNLLAHRRELGPRWSKAVKEWKKSGQMELTRKLVRLNHEVDLSNIELSDLLVKGPNLSACQQIFTELGFRKWIKGECHE